jgi:hypothetical protein
MTRIIKSRILVKRMGAERIVVEKVRINLSLRYLWHKCLNGWP